MFVVESEALLPRFEEEPFTHFQEEAFDLSNDGGLQIGLGISAALRQAKELQNQRLLEQIVRPLDGVTVAREPANACFVAAESEALVQAGIELALQFADCPILLAGFDFVETALFRVFDSEEEDVMRPAQREG